ncbi:MAG: hypothetical protein CM1200mP34_1820 [Verrucomicrobiales bacterium]|nr:MAG: hypothetical protein CM1200mP34_1820 [Verrucomicrobiales bacterium]
MEPQAREFFDKGLVALRKENLSTPPSCSSRRCGASRGVFECREALRLNQFKRAGKKSGFFRMFGKTTSSSLLRRGSWR